MLIRLLLVPCLASAANRQTVRAVFAGAPTALARIVAALRPSLDRQGLVLFASFALKIDPLDAVRVTPTALAAAPVAYLWLDLSAPQPTLFLVESRTGLVYARPLRVHADPDDVETEFIRFVVDQSLDALLSGSAPAVTPEEFRRSLARRPANPVSARPSESSAALSPKSAARNRFWGLSAGYSLSALGADAVEAGPELGAELCASHVHLKLRLAQRLPLSVTRNGASVRLVSSALRLVASSPFALGTRLTASLGLGAGLDVTRVTPAADGAVSAFWVSDPLLLAEAAVEQSWGPWLLSGHGGIEWDVIAARYAIRRSDGANTVWVPWRARLGLGISVGYAF